MAEQADKLSNETQLIETVEPDTAGGTGRPDGEAAPDEEASWRARLERLVHIENLAETLRNERDQYLDLARRAQADLANYRKRVASQQSEQLERAGEALLLRLLPLADAVDAAAGQHPQTVAPLQKLLHSLLEAEGVERLEPTGELFDPTLAEAVEHQGEGDRQVVAEVCRPGFRWKGRLLRPASVKVRSEPAGSEPEAADDGSRAESEAKRSGQG